MMRSCYRDQRLDSSVMHLFLIFLPSVISAVPHFHINLNRPPFERWREIASQYGPAVNRQAIHALRSRIPPSLIPIVHVVAKGAYHYIQEPYRSELAGFAHYGSIPLVRLVAMQLAYDATAYCTSVVCVDEDDFIWHARNLDYKDDTAERQGLRRLIIETTFIQDNQVRLRSVTFAGLLGVFTGLRIGGYSVSLNERHHGSFFENLFAALNMILVHNKLETVFLRIRETMMKRKTYREALNEFATVPLIAPCYIIIGGVNRNEGAVITRNRFKALDIYVIDISKGRWYVLETNFDRWNRPEDGRRKAGIWAMNAMGRRDVNSQRLFGVLYTPPILNNSTVYSAVMSASQSYLQITLP